MVKKKDDESKDLTRLEDISEFLHQEDDDLDEKFNIFDTPDSEFDKDESISLDDILPELNEPNDKLDEESRAIDISDDFEDVLQEELSDSSFSLNSDTDSEVPSDFTSDYLALNPESNESINEEVLESIADVELPLYSDDSPSTTDEYALQDEITSEIPEIPVFKEAPQVNNSERFLDVRSFAQNFSYGKSSGVGGNPPFSLIARNIKYKEEADDILILLSELGLINSHNEKDIEKSLELGSLLVPQISEFTAIVLAHKLRRFDLDLEVGLTDEVHPSKSGETNPRGLIKKENIRQNKSERQNLSELDTSIDDILMTTSQSLAGYKVYEFLGVKSTFAIVEEAELEKLQYVQKTMREKSALIEIDKNENDQDLHTSEKAFRDFNDSFLMIFDDLLMQLKQKAYTHKANSLLGVNYQVSPMPFDRINNRVNAYQVTCSATIAIVTKELE